jgi:hypothetical protein
MLIDMLERWVEAAVELGDLREAKFANDRAIDLEAQGAYRHDDLEAVASRSSWRRRSARVLLALAAVRARTDPRVPEAMREKALASRSAVMADVGLDPSVSDRALRRPLAERLDALLREALETGIRPPPEAFADLAGLHLADSDVARARAALQRGLRVHVGDAFLLRPLQSLPRAP